MAVARHVWPGPDAGVPRGAPIRGHAASDDSRPRDAPFTDSGGGGIPAGSGGLLVCHRADDHHHLLGDRAAGQVVVLATQGENNGGTPSIRCLHIADSAYVCGDADSEAGRRRASSSECRVASGCAHTVSGGGFDGQSQGVR